MISLDHLHELALKYEAQVGSAARHFVHFVKGELEVLEKALHLKKEVAPVAEVTPAVEPAPVVEAPVVETPAVEPAPVVEAPVDPAPAADQAE